MDYYIRHWRNPNITIEHERVFVSDIDGKQYLNVDNDLQEIIENLMEKYDIMFYTTHDGEKQIFVNDKYKRFRQP